MDTRSESSSAYGAASSRHGLRGRPHRPPSTTGKRTETASFKKAPVPSRLLAPRQASNKNVAKSSSGTMSSAQPRIVRSGSIKPTQLCPRREFGPAQDHPARQYSLKYYGGRSRPQPASNTTDVLSKILSTKVNYIVN